MKYRISALVAAWAVAAGCKGDVEPSSSPWVPTQDMAHARYFARVTALSNGLALVSGGGENFDGSPYAEVFDPTIGEHGGFRSTSDCPTLLGGHVAVRLDDGTVLVAGGVGTGPFNFTDAPNDGHLGLSKRSYLYDPDADTWTRTGDLPFATQWGTTDDPGVLLQDGRVMVCGGARAEDSYRLEAEWAFDQYPATRKTYVWDPTQTDTVDDGVVQGRWTEAGLMAESHLFVDVFPGGFDVDDTILAVGTPIPPTVGSVVDDHRVFSAGTEAHTLVPLADGRILKVGGRAATPVHDLTTANVEIFDPTTLQWTSVSPLPPSPDFASADLNDGDDGSRCWAAATRLADDRVLVVGGDTSRLTYVPASDGFPDGTFTGTPEHARRTSLIYAPGTDTWSYTPAQDLVTPRGGPDLLWLPGGDGILAIGGRYLEDFSGDYLFVEPTLERFDPSNPSWTVVQGADMPSRAIQASDYGLTNATGSVNVSLYFSGGYATSAALDDGTWLSIGGEDLFGTGTQTTVARRFIPEGTGGGAGSD